MLRQKLANLLQFDRPNLSALEQIRVGHDTSVTEGRLGVPNKVELFFPAQQHIPPGKPPRTTRRLVRLNPPPVEHLALRKNLRCAPTAIYAYLHSKLDGHRKG